MGENLQKSKCKKVLVVLLDIVLLGPFIVAVVAWADAVGLGWGLGLGILPVALYYPLLAIHEGLHVIALLWNGVDPATIRVRRKSVHVEAAPRKAWIRCAVFPLLLPLVLAIATGIAARHLAPAIALGVGCSLGSIGDLAEFALVLATPGPYVTDREDGLYVHDDLAAPAAEPSRGD